MINFHKKEAYRQKRKIMGKKVYSGVDVLPHGEASEQITDGCIVLEGGAFRGVYGEGALDALMAAGINMECTVGVSAGALNGMNYVSGQIGRSAYVNLKYRHDKRYVGSKALRNSQGIIGFDFVFQGLEKEYPFDRKRFFCENRRFVAVATDCLSGNAAYFEKGKCSDIFQAIRASASMPYCSRMVWLDGIPYLDGGCSDSIPYQWALEQGYKKVIVIRTRMKEFRKPVGLARNRLIPKIVYHAYPDFLHALEKRNESYNSQCEKLEELQKRGTVFVISPTKNLGIGRLEPDMEKLGALYYLGYGDMKRQLEEIKDYLGKQ